MCNHCRGSGGTSGNVSHSFDCQYINCEHTQNNSHVNKMECKKATAILDVATHIYKLHVHALDFVRKMEMGQVNKIIILKTNRSLQLRL